MMAEERKQEKARQKRFKEATKFNKKASKAKAKDKEWQATLEKTRAARQNISNLSSELKDLEKQREQAVRAKVEYTQDYYDRKYPGAEYGKGKDKPFDSFRLSYNNNKMDKKIADLDKRISETRIKLMQAQRPQLEYNKKKAKG